MTRTRFNLVACAMVVFVGVFVAAAGAFRTITPAARSNGSLTSAASMLEARSGHTATLLPDGKVLIAGGMRRNQDFYRSAELYDPATSKFQHTGEMSLARVGHVAVLLRSGKVLIAGGWIGRGTTDGAELYDPASGKFTVIAKMTTRRAHCTATLLDSGDVLLTGGADHDGSDGAIASSEVFRNATLSFQPAGSMHFKRIGHTATLLQDGRLLIAGGKGDGLVANAEVYDPKSGTFRITGPLLAARYKHTAGLMSDGRVLVAGGSDERDWSGTLNSAEIYDPATGKFTATSAMSDSRFKLPVEAARLVSGNLLVVGGSKNAEVFDPVSGKFFLVSGEMSDKWHFMTETQLRDGRVLLAGGYANNDQATAQSWIYRP